MSVKSRAINRSEGRRMLFDDEESIKGAEILKTRKCCKGRKEGKAEMLVGET